MRLLALAFCLGVGISAAMAPTARAQAEVSVVNSKLLGLLEFTVSISGSSGANPVFRGPFEASEFATLDTEALRRLGSIDLRAYDYQYVDYPATHGQTIGAWDFFRMAAAKASGWGDLRDRTAGLYANEVQYAIISAMRDAEPAYDALIWGPHGEAAERQADSLQRYADRQDLGSMVHRLSAFYGSVWPAELPLRVALHPFPPGRGFSAGVAGNVVMSGMSPGFDDNDVYLSVVLHEVAHQLFAQQPPALAHTIRATMTESPFPGRRLAYRWLDEALATAASNGWVYRELTGALDEGAWYNNRIIDEYARALYPRVAEYIEGGREIDDEFLEFALTEFEATFPEATTDPEALFPFFSLATDAGGGLDVLLAPLYERYRLRGPTITTDFSDTTLKVALDTPGLMIVLLAEPDPEKLALLRRHLPDAVLDAPQEAVFALTPEDHPVLLLRIDDPDALRRILDRAEAEGMAAFAP